MTCHTQPGRSSRDAVIAMVALIFVGGSARPAAARQSVSDVLSFLLTNRSIPTDDFVQDEQAAAATHDTISRLLLLELTTLPISSSAGGFTYRLNRALGTVERSSDAFGPFFIERPLTAGKNRTSLGLSYRTATFDNIDGRDLRDGTLVATASKLRGDVQPFDVETLSLRIHTDTVTLTANYGPTDRLDLSAAIPVVRLALSGERVDTHRGRRFLQAAASASASGVGDLIARAKYNVLRSGGRGLAIGGETRLPTGSKQNLLGSGEATIKPRLMASLESERLGVYGNVGYSFGGLSGELDYGGAVTVVSDPRVTLVGEVTARRLRSFGRLTDTTAPHPHLIGVDTIRLTGTPQVTERIVAVAGIKWNVASTWLLSGSVLWPLTTAGLNARWIPTLTFDYSFRR